MVCRYKVWNSHVLATCLHLPLPYLHVNQENQSVSSHANDSTTGRSLKQVTKWLEERETSDEILDFGLIYVSWVF